MTSLHHLLLLLLPITVSASGGVSIFLMHTDLFWLGISLTFLVFVTIVFEQAFHHCKHSLEHSGALYKEVFNKIQGELTVLGFISIMTILIAQFTAGNPLVAEVLPEFEISHIW